MSGLGEAGSSELVQQVVEAARWPAGAGRVLKTEIVVVEDASTRALIAANCGVVGDAKGNAGRVQVRLLNQHDRQFVSCSC